MKIEIEPQDIEAIAQRVSDILRPTLARIERGCDGANGSDVILDVKGLAEYLQVTSSWIYRQVSLRGISHFKVGKYGSSCRGVEGGDTETGAEATYWP